MPGEDGLAADRQPARDDDDADPAADRARRRRRPHPRARGRRRRLPAEALRAARAPAAHQRHPAPGAEAAPRAEPPKTLQLGEVRYDLNRGELWRGRDLIRLTATEAMLMRIFAARAHEPVTRQRAGRGPRRRRRRGAGARRRRADHPPAPQDRGRPTRAALPADGARLGLHAGAGLTGRHLPPFESPDALLPPPRFRLGSPRGAGGGEGVGSDCRRVDDYLAGLLVAGGPGPRRRAGRQRGGRAAVDRRVAAAGQAAAPPRPDGRRAAHPRDRHARRLLDDLAGAGAARGRAARQSRGGAARTPRSRAPTSPAPASPSGSR